MCTINIVEIFHESKLSQFGGKLRDFAEKTFVYCSLIPPIVHHAFKHLQRNLLIGTKQQNTQMFSPAKVSIYTVFKHLYAITLHAYLLSSLWFKRFEVQEPLTGLRVDLLKLCQNKSSCLCGQYSTQALAASSDHRDAANNDSIVQKSHVYLITMATFCP